MPCLQPASHICEIVKAAEVFAVGKNVVQKKHVSHGLSFEAIVELADGSLLLIRDVRIKGSIQVKF